MKWLVLSRDKLINTFAEINFALQTNTSNSIATTTTTTSAGTPRRPPRWSECASFLFSEVAFSAYEEVVRVQDFRHRCLVILGARGVGRRALRKALVRARPDLFAQVIPRESGCTKAFCLQPYMQLASD